MYLTVVAMASLLMMAFNLNSNMNTGMNAYASILSDIQNVDDVGQSLECVIVVVGCDGTGSVGSSGDVIVGSGQATLTVIKEVDCESTDGRPSDTAVCDAALEIATPDTFPMRIEANNPNPSEFDGSSTGTDITLNAGVYRIYEDIGPVQDQLEQALSTEDISFNIDASGDCDNNDESADARGTIGPGQEQTCIITNTVVVGNGTAPIGTVPTLG